MENNNYYQVQGWMVNDLKLKGNELICYAVIYSFSQDKESKFMGGVKYLRGWMNASEPTVISTLDKLTLKGLIEPIPVITKTCKRVYYQVTKESLERGNLKNLSKVPKESLETLYNNNNNNKTRNKKLSNDNQKDDVIFEDFYKIYPLKKSRRDAEKAWGKLSLKDKKEAIKRLPAYIADCLSHNRSYQYPARYLNAGTWNDQFDDDETGEMKEDDTPTLLPPGMTQEQWEKVSAWMVVYIKHIAGKITPIMLAQMKKDVNGNSSLLSDILVDLDERLMDLCNYDVYKEFKKLLKEDEYKQQL